ncbi:CHAP domain-containing protein [Sphingomonas baiyangensis]|uniref:CHAP domain-containing protein n=1 Tax=Sphingomonas baiyangensis TaxID=2572576 RepID=A0A4U1L5S6_9SPHN|nr:CHAP domain-containing protein [Sphingomonas baiyangensis]TKD52182.1 CHAP domain-containing protein [Sphingomonas baiyangensis]
MRWWVALIGAAMMVPAHAAPARASVLDYVGECVPFARMVSGIQIWGDAWTWWQQASGKYERGSQPRVGAVLVFQKTGQLRLGHVAVVSRIIEDRVVMVTHANWSRIGGKRGAAEQDVTLFDVSEAGDWSRVKVWYRDNQGLGGSTYPVHGFIYGKGGKAPPARTLAELSSPAPDYVGSLIDAYAR